VYSDAVRRYALDVARAGSLGEAAAAGEAGAPACGDAVRIELDVTGGRVEAARYRAFGCPHATAAAALTCELVEGGDLLAAARIGAEALAAALAPAPASEPCVALAADALHGALARAAAAASLPARRERVLVAMSGGVDSAVALLAAHRAGLEPVGVTLRLWIDPAARDGERACCSPGSVRAARAACHALGVPHFGLDLAEEFRRAVVADFLRGYAAGATPNPCVRCNGGFRFDALLAAADRLGAARVATGHYARVVRRDGRALVGRGADPAKDQSYMLAGVGEAVLDRVWFPLGGQTKEETRAQARAAGLAAAGRAESQEVCFVGGGDYRAFLDRHGAGGRHGEVVDGGGRVLARHAGVGHFTPGQRRGLGIDAGGAGPLYVIATDGRSGRVTVGPRARLRRTRVEVSPGRLYVPAGRVEAQLRYRSRPVPATVHPTDGGFELVLDRAIDGVACGQTAVVYDGGAVVGAGVIAGATAPTHLTTEGAHGRF
jgi:tRNA-uridine 2-sulfurtransferase